MKIRMTRIYRNIETGELMTRDEMIRQGEELYDLGDWTNGCEFFEYYEKTPLFMDDLGFYFMNKQTGVIMTASEMFDEGMRDYNLGVEASGDLWPAFYEKTDLQID